ncbi:PREDICTED: DNA ligase 6 [Tarenaya hassleriana]|uniref:DNA ligase 6 n=1 Tax=Tarenaya hassleriana TaxID=28532 RepID=UPI00053C1915|nr:PREDICTED: DNA ligase 6 [Tarenaya hassleriana]
MDDEISGEKNADEIARPLGEKSTDLDVDLNGNRKLNEGGEELSISEPTDQSNNLVCVSDDKFSFLRLELNELGCGEGSEKTVEELRNFLPRWVTREQVLYMIRDTGENVVEIVNNFYEHETKFYEQVASVISVTSSKRVSCGIEEAPVPGLDFISCIPEENGGSHLTQFHKLQGTAKSLKSSVSPVKRNKKIMSKPKKKAKAYSKPKSTDSKQATITKFFNKVSSNKTKA